MDEVGDAAPSTPVEGNPGGSGSGSRRRKWLIAGIVVAVVLVGAVAGAVYWYVDRDNPEAVSLDEAVESLDDSDEPADTTQGSAAPAESELDGTWVVDTSVGEFSFGESTASFLGFRVGEELTIIGANEAVGRTPVVSGSMELSGTEVTSATIEGDLTAIVSDESRREQRIQDSLETGTYPTATFVLTQPIELGSIPSEGEAVDVTAVGDLTIHGVTQSVEVPLEGQRTGNLLVVVGSLEITFADYGVETPTAPVVLSVDDHGTVELQLFFARA
ncbi:MAG: hypothetical protein JJLCMIEE_01885 [Acidimicrobiales bacterium]|nr:MAG: YceI family protein [Actinomycetota bacterium]MBV6508819.1 hypothetical protein [Acidimicrobiales bacterium]RIK04948.1 MAG: hypothetical protein DCC48_11380 [Acidobacteriota bacterium]